MSKIYKNVSEQEKSNMVLQYEPLINKITKQFICKIKNIDWESIKSMAYEGFVLALLNYDNERSQLSFAQYAGWCIRNNILSSLNKELRTVSMSSYAQNKAKKRGDAVFNSVSIDVLGAVRNESDRSVGREYKEYKYGLFERDKFSDGDPYKYLYTKLEDNFSERDCNIFYNVFGLKDFDTTKNKDVARKFGVSEGLISQRIKKIILYIRKDEELIEILGNIL